MAIVRHQCHLHITHMSVPVGTNNMATMSDLYGQPRSAQVQVIISNLVNNPTFKKDIHTTFEVNTFPTYVGVVIHVLKDHDRSSSSIAIYSNATCNIFDKELSTLVGILPNKPM